MTAFDVLIVGAGIIGAATARECANAGLRVGLIEGGVVGGSATAAAMGHLVVMDDSPAQLALTAYSRSLWQHERDTLPTAVEYDRRGTLWLAADDEELAEVHAKHGTLANSGVLSTVLDSQSLAQAEPNLREGLAGALLVPDDAVVYPPCAARHFLEQAQQAGASFFPHRAVSAAAEEVSLADGARLHAKTIVLAVGSDCSLLPTLPLKKRKGHLIISDRYPGFARHQILELGYLKSAHALPTDSVAFNLQPRRTGQLLIGSSRQYCRQYGNPEPATDRAADPAILRQMIERATLYMPALANLAALRIWTGFRAATEDKLPLIGPACPLSEDASLWLTVGFEGLGITNAPGAARLLVDGLLHRHSVIDRTPYLPSRLQPYSDPAHA